MDHILKSQVQKSHYNFLNYNNKKTWMNFWYQITYVLNLTPETVLEIGPGNKTVTDALQKNGVSVTTVDIDKNLNPDFVTSVTKLPFKDESFNLVLCSEVLEHLPFEKFKESLVELKRVSKKYVILGLPNAGGVFIFNFKIPLLKEFIFFCKLPFFWKKHKFNGEHYWETGKKHYSVFRIKKDIKSVGFKIKKVKIYHDDPAHIFFVLEK